jgi:hypothetical protein
MRNGMNHRFVKSLIVSFVSLTLLQYSAAWAMLKCLHDDDHSTTPVEITETGLHAEPSSVRFPSNQPGRLACFGFDYHAESLAGPSSSSQLDRWTACRITHVADFSVPEGISAEGARVPRAGFDGVISSIFRIDLPRYLSLSVLRL